jgi:stalled ribosome rescue protein Dom34
MILSDILFELKRIANALEAQSNISSFPIEMQSKKASIPSMSNSNIEEQQESENRIATSKIRKQLEEAEDKGFFFAEDTISEEELERLI